MPVSQTTVPDNLILTPVSRRPTLLRQATIKSIFALQIPTRPLPEITGEPDASIIIVTFNSEVFTRLCLASVIGNTDSFAYEIVIIDNASSDGTPDYLRSLTQAHPQVRVLFNTINRGFAAANNQGLNIARGKTLVLLNNDTIVPPGWLRILQSHLADDTIGLVGPVTNRIGNEAQIDISYETYADFLRFAADRAVACAGQTTDLRMLAMFCVAMDRTVFEKVGPLDERFGLGMFEDDDYAMRVRATGRRVVCAEDAFVHHFSGGSFGMLAATGEYAALFETNKKQFEAKWNIVWTPHQRRSNADYQHLVDAIARSIDLLLPASTEPGAIAVVSHGDEHLLQALTREHRPAWHLPRRVDGTYAGHHPANAAEAITAVVSARDQGARYLLIPRTAAWWLDFYPDLRQWLDQHCERSDDADGSCILFDLGSANQ